MSDFKEKWTNLWVSFVFNFGLSTSNFDTKTKLTQKISTVPQTVTNPITILVGGIAVSLDLVHGTKPLRQLRRKLIVELAPVFVADLCLEAVKDLKIFMTLKSCTSSIKSLTYILEHFVKIRFRVAPRSSSVAEENKIRNHPSGVNRDHLTHATKSGVLLFIVANVSQRWAPKEARKILFSRSPQKFQSAELRLKTNRRHQK